MKVLYDSQAFDMQSHGGVSRCFVELYKHLPKSVHAKLGVYETANVYLQDMGFFPSGYTYEHFMFYKNFPLKWTLYKAYYNFKFGNPERWDKRPLINRHYSKDLLIAGDYDVFHPTHFNNYFLDYLNGKPFVLTIHDMIPELFPQYYPSDNDQIINRRLLVPLASHIVTVSEQTKKDVMRILKVPEEKISVIYHGADSTQYILNINNHLNYEYLLYVGDRNLYKNFIPFCRECIPVLKRHKDLKIVCTGLPFNKTESAFFESYGIKERFLQQFVKNNQELMDLYHNALAFVYPSAYEGFGIPILEAYKADCPVMLNRASCFPEIAGDAAIYFEMKKDSSNFEEQFENLYHMDSNEREALLQKQRGRMNRYSWDRSALSLAGVYESVIG